MKIVETIFEIIGWLWICIATTLAAALIGFLLYLKWQTDTIKIIGFVLVGSGFLLGSIWATRIWIKYGTINWLSNIRRTS